LYNSTFYIAGGSRFFARYPDIIINKYDIIRAKNILIEKLITINNHFEDDITELVYNILNVKDVIYKDYNTLNIFPWTSKKSPLVKPPFVKYSGIFLKKTFKRKTIKQSYWAMIYYPNTLTNIVALTYTVADCREIAWLTLLFCNAGNISPDIKYRICYTTLYTVSDSDKKLHELFDHVFVIKILNDGVTIIDPFARNKQDNGIIMHNSKITVVNNLSIKDYTIIGREKKTQIDDMIFFECGSIFVNGVKKHRLFAKPKIYDGSIKTIDATIFNSDIENNVLVWNKPFPYTNKPIWHKHKDWDV